MHATLLTEPTRRRKGDLIMAKTSTAKNKPLTKSALFQAVTDTLGGS
jgi:hypothetical protein